MNVDYGVTLRVGGDDVLQHAVRPGHRRACCDASRRHDLPKPEVRITAADQTCALSHVSLWRDVYYTNEPAGDIRWAHARRARSRSAPTSTSCSATTR